MISISLTMSQSGVSEREGAGYKTVLESLMRAIKPERTQEKEGILLEP